MIKILGILCVIIVGTLGLSIADIPCIDSLTKQGLLSVFFVLFIPYLWMPILLTKRNVDLINQINNREKKDELVLKIKEKYEKYKTGITTVSLYPKSLAEISQTHLCKAIASLLEESKVASQSNIYKFKNMPDDWYEAVNLDQAIRDLINELKCNKDYT